MVDAFNPIIEFLGKLSSERREAFLKSLAPNRRTEMVPIAPLPHQNHHPQQVTGSELIALNIIVMSLVATMAKQHELSGGGRAQDWINNIAACCQEAILVADMSASDGGDTERLRRKAIEHVNRILGRVHFPIDRDNAN